MVGCKAGALENVGSNPTSVNFFLVYYFSEDKVLTNNF